MSISLCHQKVCKYQFLNYMLLISSLYEIPVSPNRMIMNCNVIENQEIMFFDSTVVF